MSPEHGAARRRFIQKLLLVSGASLLPSYSWAWQPHNRLMAVHSKTVMGQLALTFELPHQPHYHIFTLKHPARLVVDFDQTDKACDLEALKKSGLFKTVRWAHHKDGKLRLVFELANAGADIHYHSKREQSGATSKMVLTLSGKGVTAALPSKRRDIVIVIDPGHGGKDPGATGKHGTHEKNVVLAIARKLKRQIDQTPGFRAVMTRDSDRFIPLMDRVKIAHRHKADVFVSVHADACTDRRVTGSSVYILSEKGASSVMARRLADRENSADLIGGISLKTKDKMLAKVLLDLSQTGTITASANLAEDLIGKLAQHEKALHRNVERAAFVVLKSPDIPSVLVETAFISNPREEKRLRTTAFQNKIATSLHQGLVDYCHTHISEQELMLS
ncbi:N-acetylmuramoyl-L-alanine amidase [Gallaecimonas mangrovi]|uniref:N-acetylmuramoyl-L-alanine amidase n=1 Tax=Gallaecimonas mangrovi TaxID=2291597 RepID=UPI000E1FF1B1|nr:N-acetylmuramoyl-L-alanine amidase [Gallaecimonas mangrovi]